MQRGVIFDLDGLLLDTEPLAAEAWRLALDGYGHDFSPDLARSIRGRNHEGSMAVLRGMYGDAFPFAEFTEKVREHYSEILLTRGIGVKPGVHAAFDLLRQLALPYGIATSTRRGRAEQKLAMTGLSQHIEVLVAGDEVAHSKPDPEIFIKAAEKLGSLPGNSIVLEDSEAGLLAGIAARMTTVLIPDEVMPRPEVVAQASFHLQSLTEFPRVLQSLGWQVG